jgi:hypothetical protein
MQYHDDRRESALIFPPTESQSRNNEVSGLLEAEVLVALFLANESDLHPMQEYVLSYRVASHYGSRCS